MRTRAPLLAFVAALVVGVHAAVGAASSGVTGTVIRGPITPVCKEGVSCGAPAAGIALGFTRQGIVVGRTTTAKDGTFRILLHAGSYGVRWLRSPAIGVMRPRSVVVQRGHLTTLKLVIDTGIRSMSGDRTSLR